jgi:cytochrome c biogenesis protein CcdA
MAALVAFVVAALTMVLLMFALSLAVALAQSRLVNTLKANVHEVKRWGGWILILVGLWLIVLGIWADYFIILFKV